MVDEESYSDRLAGAVDDGFFDARKIAIDLIVWLGEDRIKSFCESYELFSDGQEPDDEEEDDGSGELFS